MRAVIRHMIEVDNRGKADGSGNASSRREKGAAMVEMAILMPLLVLLMVGIMEVGGAFKDFLTTSSAVREGTRALSALGDDPQADCIALLDAVDAMNTGARFENIEKIEIYIADANGDQITSATNTYTFSAGDPEDCNDWNKSILYPPENRNVLVGDTDLDIVGMRITYRHDWYTGFPPFTGFITIDEQTITRLEPEGFG